MRVSARRIIGSLALAGVAAALPATLSAQSAARLVSFAAGGGLTVPAGDLSDGADLGFHVFGMLQANPALQPFSIRGDLQYHRMGLSEDVFDEGGVGDDVSGHIGIIVIGGSVALDLAPRTANFSPYVLAGAAYYDNKVSLEADNVEVSTSEGKFGWNAGAGLRFRTGGATLFVEGRFHSSRPEFRFAGDEPFKLDASFIPISLGISF